MPGSHFGRCMAVGNRIDVEVLACSQRQPRGRGGEILKDDDGHIRNAAMSPPPATPCSPILSSPQFLARKSRLPSPKECNHALEKPQLGREVGTESRSNA